MIQLTLKPEYIQIIAQALGEVPYKFAQPVLAEMQAQVNAQQKPVVEPTAEGEPSDD